MDPPGSRVLEIFHALLGSQTPPVHIALIAIVRDAVRCLVAFPPVRTRSAQGVRKWRISELKISSACGFPRLRTTQHNVVTLRSNLPVLTASLAWWFVSTYGRNPWFAWPNPPTFADQMASPTSGRVLRRWHPVAPVLSPGKIALGRFVLPWRTQARNEISRSRRCICRVELAPTLTAGSRSQAE